MAKNGTEFSKYAQTFYRIIYENKGQKAVFVKELLKMGLTDEDKEYIKEINSDVLRKYLLGINDISNIVGNLETKFDDIEFKERFCEELCELDEAKIIKFGHSLQLAENTCNIEEVSEAIAEYHVSIIKRAASKNRTFKKSSKDKVTIEKERIVQTYTISEAEKRSFVQLCKLIKEHLNDLERLTIKISNKQYKQKKLTASDIDKIRKLHLEYEIESVVKKFGETSSEIKVLCSDLVKLIVPKQRIDKEFLKLISFANNIDNDEYRVMDPDSFNYSNFWYMISRFKDSIDKSLRAMSKL